MFSPLRNERIGRAFQYNSVVSDSVRPHRRQPAHQAPPSLGFSRQEHWSGLPFPSPVHKSEKWKVKAKLLSRVRLLATPWTAAHQGLPSMGFSRQEYWSGVPLPCLVVGLRHAFSVPVPKWNNQKHLMRISSCLQKIGRKPADHQAEFEWP